MIFFLLIFMFFLGITQVIWAIVLLAATRIPEQRRHLGIYLAGVILYFIVLATIQMTAQGEVWDHPLSLTYFFGGAFILAIYHILIVVKRGNLF